ncbi:DUF1127 domain-containing protein [Salinicola corii]|uniref:DUF1127 domain-containing protein n=2 Tax=Salinicola corii TaxID=2606937 RepID=A0A640W9X5_9GAMM|nr:DUF1127 domain-containing protein [Salinicola corii]
MKISNSFNALLKRFAASRQCQRDLRALRGLNDHMLEDIGLRREENQIVSAFPVFDEKTTVGGSRVFSESEQTANYRETADMTRAVEAMPGVESLADKTVICRYCGERLA